MSVRHDPPQQVVLLDEAGRAVGAADKAAVHHRATPLHLAFSCYVFDPRGHLLITRRAETKRTWPGTWTNTCCGHPEPGESLTQGVHRRLSQELGVRVRDLTLVLPRFRYRAVMPDGTVENEMCPVFRATSDGQARLNPAEVAEARWLPWREFAHAVADHAAAVSPWCRLQVAELTALGDRPAGWPAGDSEDLPAGAHL